MELRHLRYFLAVAEHGSVAEAARHLHIAQPALSRQIKDLEEELGVPVFSRTTKGVEFTPAGRQFALDVRRVRIDLDAARERAIRIGRGEAGSVRIGVSPTYSWHPTLLRHLHRFQTRYPDITIMLEPALAMQQLDAIADGRLEGGFLGWRHPEDNRFEAKPVLRCGLRLAMPSQGPLARDVPSDLTELRDKPWIWFARDAAPPYYDFLIQQCREIGFSPNIVQLGGNVTTILGLVAAGLGYSIVPDSSVHSCPSAALLIEHPALSAEYNVEFVWRPEAMNPTLQRFIDGLDEVDDSESSGTVIQTIDTEISPDRQ